MAGRDFKQEAFQESERRTAFQRWYQARRDAILGAVSAHDVLRRNGVQLRQAGSDREEQFSCPFHGNDRRPSARVYPDSARSPSHAWCFVCQERWDAIGLWRKYSPEAKFGQVLGEMERVFGLVPPEAPPPQEEDTDPELLEVLNLFDLCERRLLMARAVFDMRGYLALGTVLDRLWVQVEEDAIPSGKAREVLHRVLDKIGEKVRVCPVASK